MTIYIKEEFIEKYYEDINECHELTVKIWVANCSLARGLCKSTTKRARSSYIKHKLFNQAIWADTGNNGSFLTTIESASNYKYKKKKLKLLVMSYLCSWYISTGFTLTQHIVAI